jgi:hypothetical protein
MLNYIMNIYNLYQQSFIELPVVPGGQFCLPASTDVPCSTNLASPLSLPLSYFGLGQGTSLPRDSQNSSIDAASAPSEFSALSCLHIAGG